MAKKQTRDLSALVDFKDEKERKAEKELNAVRAPTSKTKGVRLKPAMFRVRPDAKKQFGILAKELDRTEQELIAEAMNMVFERYGKDPFDYPAS